MIQFYPSKFVLITDILDNFGEFGDVSGGSVVDFNEFGDVSGANVVDFNEFSDVFRSN